MGKQKQQQQHRRAAAAKSAGVRKQQQLKGRNGQSAKTQHSKTAQQRNPHVALSGLGDANLNSLLDA
eukprot:1152030-Pelagomonas_calceolata.AAC.20